MSTKPVNTRATTATRAGRVRHGVGHKAPFSGRGRRNAASNILQLNTEGLTAEKISVIEQLAYKDKAFIIVLQETHCTTSDKLVIPNLDFTYFVQPVHVQDSLKTPNVKSLEGSDVTAIQCPSLACIEQCRGADGIVNLGACGKITVCKNTLGQPPEGSVRQVNTMLNLCSEITCGGNDASHVRELFNEAKLILTDEKCWGRR